MGKPYLIPADDIRENPFDEKHYYKIYNDGGHFVGTRVVRSKGKRPPKRPAQTAFDIAFDSLYFQAVRKGLKNDAMADFIQAGLEKLYPASSTLRKFILEKMDKKQRNLWKRIKRFRRKANMYRWNYFVTFTYDPRKHTAESFRRKLRKCLSNLHTRRPRPPPAPEGPAPPRSRPDRRLPQIRPYTSSPCAYVDSIGIYAVSS